MKQILAQIEGVFDSITKKEAQTQAIQDDAKNVLASIRAREDRVAGIESAQTVLAQAEVVQKANAAEKASLVEEKIAFENLMREERRKLSEETARLLPLQDKERQLFVDRQNLYAAQKALDEEKATYVARITADVKAHFANTNGR